MYVSLANHIRQRKSGKSVQADLESGCKKQKHHVVKPDAVHREGSISSIKFCPEWEFEFLQSDHQVRTLRAVCAVGAIFFSISSFYGLFKSDDLRVAGGSKEWIILTWIPHLISGFILGAFFFLLGLSGSDCQGAVRCRQEHAGCVGAKPQIPPHPCSS
jgi:hypothetical protein